MKSNKIIVSIAALLFVTTASYGQTTNTDSLTKRHNEMMAIVMTQPKVPIKTIGILVYDGYNTLDAIGPYQTLSQIMGAKVFLLQNKRD